MEKNETPKNLALLTADEATLSILEVDAEGVRMPGCTRANGSEVVPMEQIIIALITAGLSLVGVMITNYFNNKSLSDKVTHQLEVAQAVTDTKIEELTREVRTHNNFAQRIPVMEEKIAVANHRIDDLERHEEKERKI